MNGTASTALGGEEWAYKEWKPGNFKSSGSKYCYNTSGHLQYEFVPDDRTALWKSIFAT